MSFILDALKKSEVERQRQSLPGFVDPHLGKRQQRLPLWAIVVAGLLAINLIVLAVVLLRGGATRRDTVAVGGAAPPVASATGSPIAGAPGDAAPRIDAPVAAAPQTGTDHPFSPLDNVPEYAPEIPVTAAPADARESAGPAPPVPPLLVAPRRQTRVNAEPAANDYKPADEEILPTISELHLSGAQALPDLHLDVHVYATKPADRFVYINMRKYHEGATLEEGPTLEQIRRDGVVLNDQGLRFLLPRQ